MITSIPAAFFMTLSHFEKSAGNLASRSFSNNLMNSRHVLVVQFVRCWTSRTLRNNFSLSTVLFSGCLHNCSVLFDACVKIERISKWQRLNYSCRQFEFDNLILAYEQDKRDIKIPERVHCFYVEDPGIIALRCLMPVYKLGE